MFSTARLKQEIEEQDKNQAALARRIGLTPVEFYQRVVGFHGLRFSADHRRRLSELLHTPESELFPEVVAEAVND